MEEKLVDQVPSALNHEELLARCMGNIEFAERVLDKFQQSFGADLVELERGLDSEDAERVTSVAHRLKGASASVSAPGLSQWAAEIEQLGRTAQLSEVPIHLEGLRKEWSRFVGVASSPTVWPESAVCLTTPQSIL
jgi:HPt (histidine-containing phosphotransfer) domain-containing protein